MENKRTNMQFKAFDLAMEANATSDLEIANAKMLEAIKLYPTLPNARRRIGQRLYDSTLKAFSDQEGLDFSGQTIRHFTRRMPSIVDNDPQKDYWTEAERWLLEAVRTDDIINNGSIFYYLANLYAMRGRLPKVREYLARATAEYVDCVATEYMTKAVFLYACESENDFQGLNEWLKWESLAKTDIVFELIHGWIKNYNARGAILCRKKPTQYNAEGSGKFFYLRLQKIEEDKYSLTYNNASRDSTAFSVYSPYPNDKELLTLEETVKFINSICWVISDTSDPLAEYYRSSAGFNTGGDIISSVS